MNKSPKFFFTLIIVLFLFLSPVFASGGEEGD